MTGSSLSTSAVHEACRVADEWLALRRRVLRVPGVQAAVLYDGALVMSSAHGWADLEAEVPLTSAHVFRVASHSKTFTATAILQLTERGLLRLDDRLGDHLEWLDESAGEVTVREVLSHGGGLIRDGAEADHWVLERRFPDAKQLREMSPGAAILPRNERFKYSNVGYALLGQVIETVTGRPYAEHLQTEVIDRLGLVDTRPELDPERSVDHATGYSALASSDRRLPIEHVDTRAFAPATGFSSTAEELVRYAGAHVFGDERLLSDSTKRLAQREEWAVGEEDGHYGLGLEVLSLGERRVVGHGGAYPGHATKTLVDPVAGLAVSVCTNAIDGPAAEMATGVVRLVNLAGEAGSDEPGTDLDRFTGAFANVWGRLDVVRFGSRLYGLRLHQPDPTQLAVELTPEDAETLRVTGGGTGFGAYGETMRYVFRADGSVSRVRLAGGVPAVPAEQFAAWLEARNVVAAP